MNFKIVIHITILAFCMMPGFEFKVNAQTDTNLPEAPDWEFGWNNITLLKKVNPEVCWEFDPIYDNQKVINAWGYKAGNVDEIKDLIPEPLYNIVKHPEIWGDYRINETAYIKREGATFNAYMELTQKYKGKSYIDVDGCLRNYKAGIPFPDVDVENDPQAAKKLAWNFIKRWRSDDTWSRDTVVELVDRSKRHKHVVSERRTLQFRGRIVHDPKPLYEPNPKNIDYMSTSINKAPYQVAGTIAVMYRYDLPNRNDDMWIYLPSLRRVRRMSTAERQDKMSGGKDFIWDSVETFDGSIGNYEFEIMETKTMLQPLCTNNVASNARDGYLNGVDNYWQKRKTYVMRAIPKDPVNISEIVFYVDAEGGEFRSNMGYVSDTKGRSWLYQHYPSNSTKDGANGMFQSTAVDLITRHSSKNWTCANTFNNGFTPADFAFEQLKRQYQVR